MTRSDLNALADRNWLRPSASALQRLKATEDSPYAVIVDARAALEWADEMSSNP